MAKATKQGNEVNKELIGIDYAAEDESEGSIYGLTADNEILSESELRRRYAESADKYILEIFNK